MTTIIAPRGLNGVVVAETAIGDVRGDEGFFHYRQYDATELARRRSYADVVVSRFGKHPVTASLAQMALQVVLPRPVLKISGGRVRIGFAAPTEISVVREELWRRPSEGRANAAAAVRDMEKSTATRWRSTDPPD